MDSQKRNLPCFHRRPFACTSDGCGSAIRRRGQEPARRLGIVAHSTSPVPAAHCAVVSRPHSGPTRCAHPCRQDGVSRCLCPGASVGSATTALGTMGGARDARAAEGDGAGAGGPRGGGEGVRQPRALLRTAPILRQHWEAGMQFAIDGVPTLALLGSSISRT